MSDEKDKPQDRLTEGEAPAAEQGAPEVYAIRREKDGWQLTRRTFLAAGTAAAAATAGCTKEDEQVVLYQTRGAGGGWETHILTKGSTLPADAICVCNTVPGGTPPEATPEPPTTPLPDHKGGGTRQKSTTTPTPTPNPCSCQSYSSCSCQGYCSCDTASHYWFPC
jgi:hypothetical protein